MTSNRNLECARCRTRLRLLPSRRGQQRSKSSRGTRFQHRARVRQSRSGRATMIRTTVRRRRPFQHTQSAEPIHTTSQNPNSSGTRSGEGRVPQKEIRSRGRVSVLDRVDVQAFEWPVPARLPTTEDQPTMGPQAVPPAPLPADPEREATTRRECRAQWRC